MHDTKKLGQFVGSSVQMFCSKAQGSDFYDYQCRFLAALREYVDHRMGNSELRARPVLDQVIGILNEVKRRGYHADSRHE